ncbi:Wzz/FepE/Etk N-terminal domain-containing protein [Sphingobacterium faecium]|jgi:hypothetical protein|uniref:Wzz/FepE/Etk N-terminal domain-containing protein n=1 Tax=Sphingobacterium faecium TaxID=34087 RepID=UPI003DA30F74
MLEENKTNGAGDAITLKELVLKVREWNIYLFSKWYIIVLSGALVGITSYLYAKWKKPIYTATTTFVLESGNQSGGLGQYAGMAAMIGIDLGGSGGGIFQGDNIIELYKSRSMLEKTLLSKSYSDSNELLIDRYIDFNNLRDQWKNKPELLDISFTQDRSIDKDNQRLRDSLITAFSQAINKDVLKVGKPDKKLSIIQVDVVSRDEVFSKSFNETLVQHVNEFYIQTKTSKSLKNILVLQEKVDSVRTAMSGAIYSAVKVLDATPNLNPTRQVQRIAPSQQAQFSAETNKAILAQLVQNLELTKMNLMQEQPLIQVVDQPVYPLKVQEGKPLESALIGIFLGGIIATAFLSIKLSLNNILRG